MRPPNLQLFNHIKPTKTRTWNNQEQFPTNWQAGIRVNEWVVGKLSDHLDQCSIAASRLNTRTDTVLTVKQVLIQELFVQNPKNCNAYVKENMLQQKSMPKS